MPEDSRDIIGYPEGRFLVRESRLLVGERRSESSRPVRNTVTHATGPDVPPNVAGQ